MEQSQITPRPVAVRPNRDISYPMTDMRDFMLTKLISLYNSGNYRIKVENIDIKNKIDAPFIKELMYKCARSTNGHKVKYSSPLKSMIGESLKLFFNEFPDLPTTTAGLKLKNYSSYVYRHRDRILSHMIQEFVSEFFTDIKSKVNKSDGE